MLHRLCGTLGAAVPSTHNSSPFCSIAVSFAADRSRARRSWTTGSRSSVGRASRRRRRDSTCPFVPLPSRRSATSRDRGTPPSRLSRGSPGRHPPPGRRDTRDEDRALLETMQRELRIGRGLTSSSRSTTSTSPPLPSALRPRRRAARAQLPSSQSHADRLHQRTATRPRRMEGSLARRAGDGT